MVAMLSANAGAAHAAVLFANDGTQNFNADSITVNSDDDVTASAVKFGSSGNGAIIYDESTGEYSFNDTHASPSIDFGGNDILLEGYFDGSGTTGFRIREVSLTGAVACTNLNELVYNTDDDLIYRCTSTGATGGWAPMSSTNADTLDGVDSTQFVRSDEGDTLGVNGGTEIADTYVFGDGANADEFQFAANSTLNVDGATTMDGSFTFGGTVATNDFTADVNDVTFTSTGDIGLIGNLGSITLNGTTGATDVQGNDVTITGTTSTTLTGPGGSDLNIGYADTNFSGNSTGDLTFNLSAVNTGSGNAFLNVDGGSWTIDASGNLDTTGYVNANGFKFLGALAVEPATCTEGESYYNTVSHSMFICTDTVLNTWTEQASATAASNADTLDSLDSTQFVRSDADDTIGGDDDVTQTYTLGGTGTTNGDVFNLSTNATFNFGSGTWQVGGVSVTATASELNDIFTETEAADNTAAAAGALQVGIDTETSGLYNIITSSTVQGALEELDTAVNNATNEQTFDEVYANGTDLNLTDNTAGAFTISIAADAGPTMMSFDTTDTAEIVDVVDLSIGGTALDSTAAISGATLVGYDNTTNTYLTSSTVQGALDDTETAFGTFDTETELETYLTDVTNVFTNNDGALDDDDVTDDDLGTLQNVTFTTEAAGDLIYYNGTNWVNLADSATAGYVLSSDAAGGLSWVVDDIGTDDQDATEVATVTATTNFTGADVDAALADIDSKAAFLAAANIFTSSNDFQGAAFDVGSNNDVASVVDIATEGTTADTVTIGNSNVATTVAVTGGTAWSVNTTGDADFNSVAIGGTGLGTSGGAGLVGYDQGTNTVVTGTFVQDALDSIETALTTGSTAANNDNVLYHPEYPNASYDGGTARGTLEGGITDATEGPAYKWGSTSGSTQTMTVVARIPLPEDLVSLSDVSIRYKGDSATDNQLALSFEDSSGVSCGTAVTSVSTTWTTVTQSTFTTCTPDAGEYLEVRAAVNAANSNAAYLGALELNYTN